MRVRLTRGKDPAVSRLSPAQRQGDGLSRHGAGGESSITSERSSGSSSPTSKNVHSPMYYHKVVRVRTPLSSPTQPGGCKEVPPQYSPCHPPCPEPLLPLGCGRFRAESMWVIQRIIESRTADGSAQCRMPRQVFVNCAQAIPSDDSPAISHAPSLLTLNPAGLPRKSRGFIFQLFESSPTQPH